MTKEEVIKSCTLGVVIDADNLDNIYSIYDVDKLYHMAIENYLQEHKILESRKDSIKRCEILRTIYDNSNEYCSFIEFALKYWDEVNLNYFNDEMF